MKKLYYLLILFAIVACKKEETKPTIIPPQEVHYNIQSKTDSRKHIICKLWSINRETNLKDKLVNSIDTIVTEKNINLILLQNVNPVIYCIASLQVNILDNKYDTLSISIGNDIKPLIKHSFSCQTNYLDIQNEFINLFIEKEL